MLYIIVSLLSKNVVIFSWSWYYIELFSAVYSNILLSFIYRYEASSLLVMRLMYILGRCPCVATVYKIFNKILVHKKEHRIFQLQQKRYIPHLQGQGCIFFLLYTSPNNKNQRTIQVHRHTCTLQEQPSDGSLLTVARIAHLVSSSYTSWAVMF
jgi:hypothetical protein